MGPLWFLAFLKPLFQAVACLQPSVERVVWEREETHTHTHTHTPRTFITSDVKWTQKCLYRMDFSYVSWPIGMCFLFLKMDRAPPHCLGILCFTVVIVTSLITYYGLIFPSVFLLVTDEFMLPTPTTTHLLQPPPTALVPWWVPLPPLPSFLLAPLPRPPAAPPPSWDLRMGWRLTSSHFPLIEFVSCANSS